MKVSKFIEALKEFPQDLNVELTKIISISKNEDKPPLLITLDFPIIGLAEKNGDLYLVIESQPEMIAFGKDIKRLADGAPAKKEDI